MSSVDIATLRKSGKKELSPIQTFANFMDLLKPQIKRALPAHMNEDRMARLAMTAFSTSQKLQKCTPQSIAGAVMTASQLGLEPGVNGAGFLIPYGTECTFVPGWRGLVDLVARSGRGTVFTGVIYRDQEYTFTDGARRDLIIHNETDMDDAKDITHTYAVGWVKGAQFPVIELWRISKIEKHRDRYNKVKGQHYSYRDWEMYARKVPLLQVLKYMPCSIEVSNAIAVSHAAEAGRGVIIEDGVVVDMDGDDPRHDAATTPHGDDRTPEPAQERAPTTTAAPAEVEPPVYPDSGIPPTYEME